MDSDGKLSDEDSAILPLIMGHDRCCFDDEQRYGQTISPPDMDERTPRLDQPYAYQRPRFCS